MKLFLYITLLIAVAIVSYSLGTPESTSNQVASNQRNLDFETAVQNYPRGGMNIPAQWFIMDSMVGQEKMMFIFGYADNLSVCKHLVEVAKKESPERNFSCLNAN